MVWRFLLLQLLLLLSCDVSSASSAGARLPACRNFNTCRYPYVVVLDAGSTGTKAAVFQFDRGAAGGPSSVKILSEKRSSKTKPGIDSFEFPWDVYLKGYLKELIEFAKAEVPQESWNNTLIVLGATSGVRALSLVKRRKLMQAVGLTFRLKSPFRMSKCRRKNGFCCSNAFVLSGAEEGYYALLAPNLLLRQAHQPAFGIVAMGGGSTQIALSSPTKELAMESWQEVNRSAVFVSSEPNLGKSAATLGIAGYDFTDPQPQALYVSPCLNPSFRANFSFQSRTILVQGDSSVASSRRWYECQARVRQFLSSRGGSIARPADSWGQPYVRSRTYVASGGIYYTAKTLKRLGYLRSTSENENEVTLGELEAAARKSCVNPPPRGKYLAYLCMDSAFIVTLLTEGYVFSDEQKLHIANSYNETSMGWPTGVAAMFAARPENAEFLDVRYN